MQTGGIRMNTSAQLFLCKHTDGWPILVIPSQPSEEKHYRTLSRFTVAIPSSTAQRCVFLPFHGKWSMSNFSATDLSERYGYSQFENLASHASASLQASILQKRSVLSRRSWPCRNFTRLAVS